MCDNELPNLPELVVLTGAGFSKAFGLPLAKEFNESLFNLLKNNELKQKLKRAKNFEQVYTDLEGRNDANFKSYQKAVEKMFNELREYSIKIQGNIATNFRDHFINRYFENKEKDAILHFFTLNQDLVLENEKVCHKRTSGENEGIDFIYPGLTMFHNSLEKDGYINSQSLHIHNKKCLIGENKFVMDEKTINFDYHFDMQEKYTHKDKKDIGIANIKKLFYWKLHGSTNWYTENEHLIIVGTNKKLLIERHPLFKFYLEQFEKYIQGKTLLIIGYSFNDTHINNLIYNAANKNEKTVIHIVTPEATLNSDFSNKLFYNNKFSICRYIRNDFFQKNNVFLHPYKLENLFDFEGKEYPFKLMKFYKDLNNNT